jgi:type II secretory pathway pseudopilin PulG
VKRPGTTRGGFILAEALVSLGLAALTGALALTLLVWAARTIDRARARMEAATVIERLYEEARLATPADLRAVTSGTSGRYRWRRLPRGPVEIAQPNGAQRVRLEAIWTAGGRSDRSAIEAVIVGASQ